MRQRLYRVMMCFALAWLTGCSAGAMAKESMAGAAAPAPPEVSMADAPAREEMYEPSPEPVAKDSVGFAGMPGAPQAQGAPPPPPPPPGSGKQGASSEVSVMRGPILIYTAQITMAVFEVNASLGQIEDLARELGGFLSRRDDTAITIRVPAAMFDAAIKRIEKAGDVLHRNVSAQDVTEEFRDVEIRLRNARAVRDRLEQLLAKANKVEESVLVERELERVSGEIERMEGRLKYLRDRAAFSTITVTFQPKRQEEHSRGPFRLPVPWLYQLGLSRLLSL
jgi:hypothetical protein